MSAIAEKYKRSLATLCFISCVKILKKVATSATSATSRSKLSIFVLTVAYIYKILEFNNIFINI